MTSLVLLCQRVLDLCIRCPPIRTIDLSSKPCTAIIQPLLEPIDDHRHGMRANHALVVFSPKRPDGKITRSAPLLEHGIDHAGNELRHEDGIERMRRPERIPGR